MRRIDTLIEAAWVIPVEPAGVVLADHAVAIDKGRIVAVVPTAQAAKEFDAARRVPLRDHALIPGLVNLHGHAAMSLMRGIADDQPLMAWLNEHVWPAEAKHVSDEFVYDGSVLAIAEMLRGGVTCMNDMYFFPEATARAALATGMRASLGIIAFEFPSAYAPDAAGYLSKGLATRDTYRDEPMLSFCLAPHAPYTVSDATFARIVTYAEELDAPIHMHVHETREEIERGIAQHGVRPIERLRHLGIVGPRLVAVHAVHLDESEIALFAREGVSVAHCPSSNLKLASGIAPVSSLVAQGVNVGLGTDGAASNNRLDVWTELRTAALLAKGTSGDPRAVDANTALRMATLDGARAIGLEAHIGSIVVGKSADLAAVELSAIETLPCFDPVSHLAYSAGREHVTHVWVAGRMLVEERHLATIDAMEIQAKARWWQKKIQAFA